MKKNHLNKMQRKISSRRKKWTNKERLQNRWKNELRNMNGSINDNPLLRKRFKKLINSKLEELRNQVIEKGIDPDTLEPLVQEEEVHEHSEQCSHG